MKRLRRCTVCCETCEATVGVTVVLHGTSQTNMLSLHIVHVGQSQMDKAHSGLADDT